MFKQLTLRAKLLILFLAVGIIPFSLIAGIAYWKSSNALEQQAFNQLNAIRDSKVEEINRFFNKTYDDMDVITDTAGTLLDSATQKLEAVQALKKAELEKYFARAREDVTMIANSGDVRKAFTELKKYHDEKEAGADKGLPVNTDEYKKIHKEVGHFLDQYVEKYGYYGHLLNLCKTWSRFFTPRQKKAIWAPTWPMVSTRTKVLPNCGAKFLKTDSYAVEDYSPYTPSKGEQSAFIGTPIKDANVRPLPLQLYSCRPIRSTKSSNVVTE